MSDRILERMLITTATELNGVRLKANSKVQRLAEITLTVQKSPAWERFLWFVSLSLNKEMNPAAGPGPGGFDLFLSQ